MEEQNHKRDYDDLFNKLDSNINLTECEVLDLKRALNCLIDDEDFYD
jgi:hypothetical protein|tara:strand:- start:1950 stop:2090 length:141 start_codon:yes stop_codon:yes gene_type:complete